MQILGRYRRWFITSLEQHIHCLVPKKLRANSLLRFLFNITQCTLATRLSNYLLQSLGSSQHVSPYQTIPYPKLGTPLSFGYLPSSYRSYITLTFQPQSLLSSTLSSPLDFLCSLHSLLVLLALSPLSFKTPPLTNPTPLLAQFILLAMFNRLLYLPALHSSRCLCLFSFSYLQYKLSSQPYLGMVMSSFSLTHKIFFST